MVKKAKDENKPTEHRLIAHTPNWLDLPNTTVTNILLEHLEIDDYIRFSAVCREWQLIQKEHRIRYSPHTPPLSFPFPWLRFDKNTSIYFDLPSRQKSYDIPLHGILQSAYTIDNKHGWLILLINFSVLIFNPITGEHIELPHFFTEVSNQILPSMVDIVHLFPMCISSPLVASECTILIVDLNGKAYLCQLNGSSKWKIINYSGYLHFGSHVFINNKIYDVSLIFERIYMVDTLLPDPFDHEMVIEMDCSDICDDIRSINWPSKVVNFLEELVLVILYYEIFNIYKADFSTNKWVTMKTLGDHALFLSSGSNFFLPADEVGCMKNTIYLTGDLNDRGVAWRAFNLSTMNWIDGMPMSLPLPGEKYGKCWSWFLPTLDKWSSLN